MMQDERYKPFCLAAAPATDSDNKDPVCLDGGIRSGAKTLVGASDIDTMT